MMRAVLSLAMLCLLFSCKKKEVDTNSTTTVERHIYFKNTISKPVHFFLYKTQEDYKNSTNPFIAIDIQPGTPYDWYTTTLSLNYYMDWYTDGYSESNWAFIQHIALLKRIGDFPLNFDFILATNPALRDTVEIPGFAGNDLSDARNIFIHGDQPATIWKAINAYNMSNTSIWGTLTEAEKYQQLTLTKDMAFTLSAKDNKGMNTYTGLYTINRYQYPTFSAALFFDTSATNNFEAVQVINSSKMSTTSIYPTKDTLLYPLADKYYLLVRQP